MVVNFKTPIGKLRVSNDVENLTLCPAGAEQIMRVLLGCHWDSSAAVLTWTCETQFTEQKRVAVFSESKELGITIMWFM